MRRTALNPGCLLLVAAFAAASTSIHSGAHPQQPDTFRSGVEVVRVSASVRDHEGRAVTNLGPRDFTVHVDGGLRPVVSARLFDTAAESIPGGVALIPRVTRVVDGSPGRVVVIAVDRESIKSGAEKAAFESAAQLVESLSPSDAAGVIGLPGDVVDLTRDHTRAAEALRRMTGTAPIRGWQYALEWDDVLAYERNDTRAIQGVVERLCVSGSGSCGSDLRNQAREMLVTGRGRAELLLTRLTDVVARLGPLGAPKNVVLISAGVPFGLDLVPRYQALAARAAQAHVTLFVVHLDQGSFDASDSRKAAAVSGREFAAGIANIASTTGGAFFGATGRATDVFTQVASEINSFYELGLESRPSDRDGKAHRIVVEVSRPGVRVRAPVSAVWAAAPKGDGDALARAMAEPTDVAELPLEVATYVTHSSDPSKLRLLLFAAVPGAPKALRQWGFRITHGATVITARRGRIAATGGQPWSETESVELPAGNYRLRTAVIDAEGRAGVIDQPFTAALRKLADGVQASDLIVGVVKNSVLETRGKVRQDEIGAATIELTSAAPLTGVTGALELIPGGTAEPVLRQPLQLQTRQGDERIVVARARLDLASVPPGTYTASASWLANGTPMARVIRLVEILPPLDGERPVVRVEPSNALEPVRRAAEIRDPKLTDLLQRVGSYVSQYGQEASVIVGVEHYTQHYEDAPIGQPSARQLVAELALVKTADETGWAGFRDVVTVDGKQLHDREDRLQVLFTAGGGDYAQARRIAEESARFNIGPTLRNFNVPTSTLFFLMPDLQKRFTFAGRRETTVEGMKAWEIDFNERATPTLIRTSEGRDVASQGTIWVKQEDGTVLRTRLTLRGFVGVGSQSKLEVTYRRDPRLGLWVPATMTERHESNATVVTATATYSDFKRFEGTATIK